MPTPSTQHHSQTLHISQDLPVYSPELDLDLELPTSKSAAYSLNHLATQAIDATFGQTLIYSQLCNTTPEPLKEKRLAAFKFLFSRQFTTSTQLINLFLFISLPH